MRILIEVQIFNKVLVLCWLSNRSIFSNLGVYIYIHTKFLQENMKNKFTLVNCILNILWEIHITMYQIDTFCVFLSITFSSIYSLPGKWKIHQNYFSIKFPRLIKIFTINVNFFFKGHSGIFYNKFWKILFKNDRILKLYYYIK